MRRTWALGLLCVCITTFFVGYTIKSQKNTTLLESRNHMVSNVHYLSMDVERTLYGIDQTFAGIENFMSAYSHAKNIPTKLNIQPALSRLVEKNHFMESLMILDPEGETIHWSGLGSGPNIRFADFYSIHKTYKIDHLFVGRPVASETEKGKWVFGVSKGLRDASGKLLTVMVALIDLDYMRSHYELVQLRPSASITLSSLDGYIYSRVPQYDKFVGKYKRDFVRDTNLADKTIISQQLSPSDEQLNIVTSRRIGGYPLVVSISEPVAGILASWQDSARNFIILGTVVSFIIIFMTYQISGYQQEQLQIKQELKNQASTDALTGLANRRYVLEHAQHEIRKARRTEDALSFVLMDLDHFKGVNDSHGHDMGDKVLVKTANILKKLSREADIVSRYGGEEFLLLLPNTDLDGAITEAERLRKEMAGTNYRHNKKHFVVTASFGVSQWANHEESYTEALRRADKALYKVKNLGRNAVDFQETATVTRLRGNKRLDLV